MEYNYVTMCLADVSTLLLTALLDDYILRQQLISYSVSRPFLSVKGVACETSKCFFTLYYSSFFPQRDNQYHPYPLGHVRHISYQLIKAVKCEELSFFLFVQSNNEDERVGQARGRVEGMRRGRKRGN